MALFGIFYCIFRAFFLILQKIMIDTSIFQGKKAAFYTLGCKLNFSETSTFGKMLEEFGVCRAKKGERADICLINTCSVTETADSKSRQQIRRTIKNHPGAFVVVTGCYAQLKPERIVEIPGIRRWLRVGFPHTRTCMQRTSLHSPSSPFPHSRHGQH